MQNEFLWNDIRIINEKNILYLFVNYFAVKNKDKYIYDNLKLILKAHNPRFLHIDDYYDQHMVNYADKTEALIMSTLNQYDIVNTLYLGFSLKFDQWFFAMILSRAIKQLKPDAKIVVGGISTKDVASAFLKDFPLWDIAMWGEGESSLLELTQKLQDDTDSHFNDIPNVAYREGQMIKTSSNNLRTFANISDESICPDFSDFFFQKQLFNIREESFLIIEGSRGCHWNRCHFCYLNTGYKYRVKSVEAISNEIWFRIKEYGVYKFEFLDNDLIGKDINRFNSLLDELIIIRNEEPRFEIILAEIITKGLGQDIIKKMAKAGISNVQIGYESTSNELLKKVDKKNTFASNLFFIKYAFKYGIKIGGFNVITNLLEETNNNVIEAVNNLKFMRFYLDASFSRHFFIQLHISSPSNYCKNNTLPTMDWAPHSNIHFLYKNYISEENRWHIFDYIKYTQDPQWASFQHIENYYLKNKYSYRICNDDSKIVYSEYLNSKEINHYEIEKTSLEYLILSNANKQIVDVDYLCNIASNSEITQEATSVKTSILSKLEFLFKHGLVYHSSNYDEIITIIDL